MSTININEPHTLGTAGAREAIASFEEMMKKYGISADWSGNSAKLKGAAAKGSIDVSDSAVDVVIKLGMAAKMFGVNPERLEASIRKRLRAAFDGE